VFATAVERDHALHRVLFAPQSALGSRRRHPLMLGSGDERRFGSVRQSRWDGPCGGEGRRIVLQGTARRHAR
jgi:hypothetical protein